MNRHIEFLEPKRKLVDAVTDWLCGRVKNVDGAKSLEHTMVVVPTAQSGRNLRLALAQEASRRGWGGLVPPRVVEPMALIQCADTSRRIASKTELCGSFLRFVAETNLTEFPHLFSPDLTGDYRAQLAFFDQLMDIWRILARGGLAMSDVTTNAKAREFFERNTSDEETRWNELAAFEQRFFERLHALGLSHQSEDIRAARTNPKRLADSIDEVVLPMLADPAVALYDVLTHQREDLKVSVLIHASADDADKFDDWGRPITAAWTGPNRPCLPELTEKDIIRTGTDGELAQSLAADFPEPEKPLLRPALGLCDETIFPELAAAFLNRGYALHNPERYRLAVSSLGRILMHLVDLYAARHDQLPWKPFVGLLREDDVLAAVTGQPDQPNRADVLEGIDICQNAFLPMLLPADLNYDVQKVHYWERAALEAFISAGRRLLAVLKASWGEGADQPSAAFLRAAMQTIFARRSLTGSEAEKEFRAAIDAVRETLNAFETDSLASLKLKEGAVTGLLRKSLAEATYMLEPTAPHSVRTEGWLELIWSAADQVALAGFSDGAVPDAIVGHPFVPDALRVALGITSNAERLARDTMLLCDIVRSRAALPGSVRAYLSMSNAAGDQRHPSPLLFLVAPENLATRAKAMFGDLPPGGVREARRLEPSWRPQLPMGDLPLRNVSKECPQGRLSASAIDMWLKCPFTYLFKCGLGMEHVKEKTELEANDFGLLIHGTLEDYANEQLSRSAKGLAQLSDETDIANALSRLLKARQAAYGDRLPLKLRLQFDSAEGRLRSFARIQAFWARDGWRIAEKPEYRFNVRPFAGEGECDLPFKGSIDRIDYKDGVGYRLIDYKTWDNRNQAKNHVIRGGAEQTDFASRLKLPQIVVTPKSAKAGEGKEKRYRFISVQLLLYARCLECADAKFKGNIADCCYAILGKDDKDTVVFGSSLDQREFDVYQRASDRLPLLEHLNLALDTARTAIRRIRGSVFWPAGPDEEWKRDYRGLFMFSPERDLPIGTPWRDEQEAKLTKLEDRA